MEQQHCTQRGWPRSLPLFPLCALTCRRLLPSPCLPQSAVPLDGSQSLLVFEGGLRVHGLFDFLLNESFRTHGDECDVPTMLAPVQFTHASLRVFQPRVRCAACYCVARPAFVQRTEGSCRVDWSTGH